MTALPKPDSSSWLAELALVYRHRSDRTVISSRKHRGPLTIQRPFYPEGDVCHTYILHPPGGVVGGDRLMQDIAVEENAHALLTTPAATKFYRSEQNLAQQTNHLRVAPGGILEWLPQETILFDQSKVRTVTRVDLQGDARFCGWEITCLGRPASQEVYLLGSCHQTFQIYRDDTPVLIDQTRLSGSDDIMQAKWGMVGYSVTGIMLVSHADNTLLDQARSVVEQFDGLFSATLIGDVLVCRYLGYHGMQARQLFSQVWCAIRHNWIGKRGCEPRIWFT